MERAVTIHILHALVIKAHILNLVARGEVLADGPPRAKIAQLRADGSVSPPGLVMIVGKDVAEPACFAVQGVP